MAKFIVGDKVKYRESYRVSRPGGDNADTIYTIQCVQGDKYYLLPKSDPRGWICHCLHTKHYWVASEYELEKADDRNWYLTDPRALDRMYHRSSYKAFDRIYNEYMDKVTLSSALKPMYFYPDDFRGMKLDSIFIDEVLYPGEIRPGALIQRKPKKSLMSSISLIAQKLLDPSLKTLIDAGYMSSDLCLTDTGRYALEAILFAANKDALVAAAQEVIDARKK